MKRIRPVVIDGDIVRVPLTRGLEAVVDLADLALVEGRNWYAQRDDKRCYADATVAAPTRSGYTKLKMHRAVMGYGPGDPHVDHIDGDGLNNRRSNLRPATDTQNAGNQRAGAGRTSRFKGVYWYKQRRLWRAQIGVDGRKRDLGYFHDEEDGARAYDAAAIKLWGEFALTNFPQGSAS